MWTALFALKARGPVIQRELAGMLNVEGPTLTRRLARMEAEGLIERRRTNADRRAAVVRLTESGEAMYSRLSDIVSAGRDVVFRGFSPREIEEFVGYLDRLIENIESASPSRRQAPTRR